VGDKIRCAKKFKKKFQQRKPREQSEEMSVVGGGSVRRCLYMERSMYRHLLMLPPPKYRHHRWARPWEIAAGAAKCVCPASTTLVDANAFALHLPNTTQSQHLHQAQSSPIYPGTPDRVCSPCSRRWTCPSGPAMPTPIRVFENKVLLRPPRSALSRAQGIQTT
jgi:hypothetical protein